MAYQEFQLSSKLSLRRCGRVFEILVPDSTSIQDLTMHAIPMHTMESLIQWITTGQESSNPKTFVEVLREAMKASGGYGEGKRLAKLLGVDDMRVSHWKSGDSYPSCKYLKSICNRCGWSYVLMVELIRKEKAAHIYE